MTADQPAAPLCSACLQAGKQTPATHANGYRYSRVEGAYCDRHTWPGDVPLPTPLALLEALAEVDETPSEEMVKRAADIPKAGRAGDGGTGAMP